MVSQQKPGKVSIDNFQELQDALREILCRYENAVYTEDRLDVAKADKKELAHLRKELDERRKEIKRTYLAPYNAFEAQVKELLAMVDAPLEQIKEFLDEIDQREKSEKRQEIEKYYRKHCGTLVKVLSQRFLLHFRSEVMRVFLTLRSCNRALKSSLRQSYTISFLWISLSTIWDPSEMKDTACFSLLIQNLCRKRCWKRSRR